MVFKDGCEFGKFGLLLNFYWMCCELLVILKVCMSFSYDFYLMLMSVDWSG